MTWLQKGKIKSRLPMKRNSTLRKRFAGKENQEQINTQSTESKSTTTPKFKISRTNIKQTLTMESISATKRAKYLDTVKKNRQAKYNAFREKM